MAVALTVELYLNGVWVDITSDVRVDAGVSITFGVQAESGIADPSTCRMSWNNRDGRYSPRNPAGPYYGHLKRNTPVRVRVGGALGERFHGEVSEFPTRWSLSGVDVWTPVVASGVLRRLVRSNALDSTLRSAILDIAENNHIVGYWPMEDAVGSSSFGSAFPDGQSGTIIAGSPILASVDPGVASFPLPTFAGATAVVVPRGSTGTGFTAAFMVTIPETGTADEAELFRVYNGGTGAHYVLQYDNANNGQVRLRVGNDAGTEVHNTTYNIAANAGGMNGKSTFIKLEANTVGPSTSYYLQAYTAGTATGNNGSVVGYTAGAPRFAILGSGGQLTGDVGLGHVVLGDTNLALFDADLDNGLRGYAGETVNARMTRVAALAGVPMSISAGTYAPTEMGAQPDGSVLDVLRAAEAADAGGILRDSISAVGLVYLTRTARYNDAQSVVQLDYALGHLSPPLEPTDDDANVRNDVTITREGGSSARAVDTTSALSAEPYPDGIGPYPYAATLNLYRDSDLPSVAGWVLNIGTVDETRWPQVTVDPVEWPAIATALQSIRPGSRLSLINLPAWTGVSSVDLQVIGWTEDISTHTRTVTFNCVPGSPYRVLELDDAVYGVLDSTNRIAL